MEWFFAVAAGFNTALAALFLPINTWYGKLALCFCVAGTFYLIGELLWYAR